MHPQSTAAKQYQQRKLHNLCVRCGLSTPQSGRAYCPDCLVKMRVAYKKSYEKRKIDRKCVACCQPLTSQTGVTCGCTTTNYNYNSWKRATERRKDIVYKAYGNKCTCCDESRRAFLTIDHVNNDGGKHRRDVLKSPGSDVLYRWLKKNNYPSGFQILCANCHMAKSRNLVCPHKESS